MYGPNLGTILPPPRQMNGEYACGELVRTEQVLKYVRSVHARDALKCEAKQAAAGILHEIIRFALDRNKPLLINRERSNCDDVLSNRA